MRITVARILKLTATARTLEAAHVARHCVALKHSQHPGAGAIDNGNSPKIPAMFLTLSAKVQVRFSN